MSQVVLTCGCLGRTFTAEQLDEFRGRNAPAAGTVVCRSGGFGFNIYDICVNPRHHPAITAGRCGLEIRTAQSPNGRWTYGFTLYLGFRTKSTPVQFAGAPEEGYPTETDAVRAALMTARRDTYEACEEARLYREDVSEQRALLDKIQREQETTGMTQLSLF